MRPIRLSVTLQETSSGFAARVIREDDAEPYGFNSTHKEPLDAISFAAGTVMRELHDAVRGQTGTAA